MIFCYTSGNGLRLVTFIFNVYSSENQGIILSHTSLWEGLVNYFMPTKKTPTSIQNLASQKTED